jgi:hypothetical protein
MKQIIFEVEQTEGKHKIRHDLGGRGYTVAAYGEDGGTLWPTVIKGTNIATIDGKGMCTTSGQDLHVRKIVVTG